MSTGSDFSFYLAAGARRMVFLTACVLTIGAYDPELLRHPLQSPIAKSAFWEAATGRPVWAALLLTYLTAWAVPVKHCNGIRRAKLFLHDHRVAGEAATQALLGYLVLPFLSMLAIRQLTVAVGTRGLPWFLALTVILTAAACRLNTQRIVWQALRREAMWEGERRPVVVNARYEFPAEWSQVLTRFGAASRQLRAATYELVRCADFDSSLDRLSPRARTQLLAKAVADASLKARDPRSLDAARKRERGERMSSDAARTLEAIAKWRERIRSLEGEGADKLPPGSADLLPVPVTVREKLLLRKALQTETTRR